MKQNCRLVPLFRDRVGRYGLKLETNLAIFFKFSHFCFQNALE